jgi:ribosomal protein S7
LSAKEQKQKTLLLGLVKEVIDSAHGKGLACKKKIELYDNIKKNKHLFRIKKKK